MRAQTGVQRSQLIPGEVCAPLAGLPNRINLFKYSSRYLTTSRTIHDFKHRNWLIDTLFNKRVLFVGEGNFSFSRSIASLLPQISGNISATSLESIEVCSPDTKINVMFLRSMGATVLGKIDATKLERWFGRGIFDVIVFQFPNTGDRRGIRGKTSNFALIRRFLRSAENCLARNGCIIISAVNSPHYEGSFHFSEAAKDAGFTVSGPLVFDPGQFPGYEHCNTNDDNSAIEEAADLGTWLFFRKNEGHRDVDRRPIG